MSSPRWLSTACLNHLVWVLLCSISLSARSASSQKAPGTLKTLSLSTSYIGTLGPNEVSAKGALHRGLGPGVSVNGLVSFYRSREDLPLWFFHHVEALIGVNATVWAEPETKAWALTLPVELRAFVSIREVIRPWFGLVGRIGWMSPPERLSVRPGPAMFGGFKAGVELSLTRQLRLGAQGAWLLGLGGNPNAGNWYVSQRAVGGRWFELGLSATLLL